MIVLLKVSTIVVTGSLFLVASGCAQQEKPQATKSQNTMTAKACSSNIYLQKYNCSLEEVQQAALSGNSDAEYALGYMYYYGIGTVQDQKTAMLWIQRAASKGEPLAIKAQQLLAQSKQTAISNPDASSDLTKASSSESKVLSQNEDQDPRLLAGAPPVTKSSGDAMPVSDHLLATQDEALTSTAKLLNIKPSHYAVQLMGSSNKSAVLKFVQQNNIGAKSSVYESSYHGAPWYVLVYGDYASSGSAKLAINNFSTTLQNLHPWVKSYSVIQGEMNSSSSA